VGACDVGQCIMNEQIVYTCQALVDKLPAFMVKRWTMFSSISWNNSVTTTKYTEYSMCYSFHHMCWCIMNGQIVSACTSAC